MLTDIKLAFRLLAKSPGFALIAVLTLAVGIGAVTVAFSAVNSVLLKPFPCIKHQDRMLYFSETDRTRGGHETGICYADYLDLKARMTTLEGIWVRQDRTVILDGKDEPERLLGTQLSWDAFKLMGVEPILGRNFTAADAKPSSPEVALLGYGVWQRRFGGDPDVINTTVTLNNQPVQIIGVMPRDWGYPDNSTIWNVFRPEADLATQRANFFLDGHAVMKPGVTRQQVQTEADAVMGAVAHEHPETNRGVGAHFRDVREQATQDISHLLLLFLGAVSFVFLIACLNVANLILARSIGRTKEIAIRLALGAGRHRLITQFVIESLALATLGGIAGLLLGTWGVDGMWQMVQTDVPFWIKGGFDLRVFGVVFGLVTLAALIFGFLPAWQATKPDVTRELKEGGRGQGQGGLVGSRIRHGLVIIEVALALVLLVGAGLMMRSFLHLSRTDLGFNPRQVLTFRVGLPPVMNPDGTTARQFFTDLVPRLQALPGVVNATAASIIPLNQSNSVRVILPEGYAEPHSLSEGELGQIRTIAGGYFQTLQIPLLAGRRFEPGIDREKSPPVTIVDDVFARKYYGDARTAIGKRFRLYAPNAESTPPWLTIVGVVGNTRNRLERPDRQPTFYIPFSQEPENFMTVAVRGQADPTMLLSAIKGEIAGVNPGIPIYNVHSMEVLFQRDSWSQAFFGRLFTIAGIIALFLACIGVYGVMAHAVAQRTSEIGVRMALGAQPQTVINMILGSGLRLLSISLVIGFVGSWFAVRLLTGFLYGVSPHDLTTFALVPLLLAIVGLLACYLPARRATRIDPIETLRME